MPRNQKPRKSSPNEPIAAATHTAPTHNLWWRQPATWIGLVAVAISFTSLLISYRAQTISYRAIVPALSAAVNLLKPFTVGESVSVGVIIRNNSSTVAKQFKPELRWAFAATGHPPLIDYSKEFVKEVVGGMTFDETVSDLSGGSETQLLSTDGLHLDVNLFNAVANRDHYLYVFGRASFKDIDDRPHEFHFCRLYDPQPGINNSELKYCQSYNETK